MTATVGLVVVSHSRALARAAVELAREMLHGKKVKFAIAAGLDDTTIGTDAEQVVDAIAAADRGRGVVVLMDVGSAVPSAELALQLLDDEIRDRVVLCPAPLVEGLVAAAVAAATGAGVNAVAAEAANSLAGKKGHLEAAPLHGSDVHGEHSELAGRFVVGLPHGLHARPAARLVSEVGRRDARARIRNRTARSEWVGANSLSKIATLGVRPGDEVEVRVSGSQAAETLGHILALAARNFDERLNNTASTPETPLRVAPTGASPGLGIGPARSSRLGPVAISEAPTEDPGGEWRRLSRAIAAVRRTVSQLRSRTAREVGEEAAAIFDAHNLLLDDVALLDEVRTRIDKGASAPAAWSAAIDNVAAAFAALPDPYLNARAEDVRSVGNQVLRTLLDATAAPSAFSGVLVTTDLSVAEAAEVDPALVTAVLLAFGSPHAHSLMLLRAKGIPAVIGAGPGVLSIPDGTVVAVDGSSGQFLVNPPEDVGREFHTRAARLARRHSEIRARAAAPAQTVDGVTIGVGATVSSLDETLAAVAHGADFGLVRTEFLFLGRPDAPDVDEQVAVYRTIVQALEGRPIILRSLDVGGDKPLDFLRGPAEMNPFLGVRGIRLTLANPQLLADQLQAMALVAREIPLNIMFPMVSTLDELVAARRLLDEAIKRSGRKRSGVQQVGMMVEVPAAALKAEVFARHADFLSVGTNDLTQYTMAADRTNDAVSVIGDPFDPALMRLIRITCQGAAGQASVSVCGELASNQYAVEPLVGMGVRALSVAPPRIPVGKEAVRAIDTRKAEHVAEEVLAAETSSAVRQRLGAR